MFSTGYVAVAGCIDILLSRDCRRRRPSIRIAAAITTTPMIYIINSREFSSLGLDIIL